MLPDDENNKHWSNYWKKGHVTSFGKGTPDNYKSDIKTFWFHQFELLDARATILDTATGNGAVAMLAIEFSEKFSKNFTVLAADAAVINHSVNEDGETLSQYRDKIQFFSATPCEKLPFEDSSIDMVCSQFGIEYSDLTDSIPEASRVLREGGKFSAIMHHHMSITLVETRLDVSIIKEVLYEYKIFDILRDYFIAVGDTTNLVTIQAARQQPAVNTLEVKLFGVVKHFKALYQDNKALDIFLESINCFTMDHISKPLSERLTNLEDFQDNYHAMIERQDDLLNAAISDTAMDELQRFFIKSKFKDCNYKENLNQSSQIIGWNVNAQM